MPVDLNGLLRRIGAAFRDDAKLTVPLFDQLRRSVERLSQHAADLERASRGYPVLRFFADSLTVSLTPAQRGAIGLEGAVEGAGQALTAGLNDFAAGIRWVGTAVTQELAIPRLLYVARGATGSVADSLARFSEPASLYQPGARTGSDLAGELGLIFRTLVLPAGTHGRVTGAGEALEAVQDAAKWLGFGSGAATTTAPAGSAAAAGPGVAAVAADPMAPAQALEAVSWELFGVMLALPIVPTLPAIVSAEILLVQSQFQAVLLLAEAATVPLRKAVAVTMRATLTISQTAVAFLDSYASFVEGAVATMVDFAADYASSVLRGTRAWASAVSEEIGSWVRIAEIIRSVLATVFSTDLMPLLAAATGIWLPPGLVPPLTLDDLVDVGIDSGLAAARLAVEAAAQALSSVLPPGRVAALRLAAAIVLTPTPMPVETGLPPAAPPFPDVGTAFLDRRETAEFGAALARLGHQVPSQVGEILDAGAGASAALAARFHRVAGQAATGPASALGDLAEQARGRASVVMRGPDGKAGASRVAPPIADDLAKVGQAFELELAQGGILLAAAAIPVYAAELRRLWQHRTPEPPGHDDAGPARRHPSSGPDSGRIRPTSPHRLAARARVTKVVTPRIVVRLPMTELDDDLIATVVDAFGRGAVEAWQAAAQRGAEKARARSGAVQPTGAGHGR